MAVLRPLKVVHHELPGRAGRRGRRHQQPRGSVRRHAQGAVLARAVHRARRLQGRSAEEVLPAVAGPRSAAALRLLHHVHRGREGRARRDRRAALHLRSGDARRRRAGRPAREGDAALGVGRARARRSRSGSTIGCSRSRIPRRVRRGPDVPRPPESRLARGADATARPSRAWRTRRPRRASSSSGSATSASIRIHSPGRSSSTAPSRSATPGRGSTKQQRSGPERDPIDDCRVVG